jgi:hypothetical protein
VLLFAGLIGGGVLFVLSTQRHDKAVEGFARAAIGCTTTLEFSETGQFYVYEETGGAAEAPDSEGCQPQAAAGQPFDFELTGPAPVSPLPDTSISYDTGEFSGVSVATFEIEASGLYEIAVVGSDVTTVAAVGRDPSSGVSEMKRGAIVVTAAGVLLGGLLLGLAGRRSKRASTPSIPDGPGWGDRPNPEDKAWPPAPPRVPQVPVNPQQPDVPASVASPPPPLPARAPGSAAPSRSPWAPPPPGDSPVDTSPPEPMPDVKAPELPPVLPD